MSGAPEPARSCISFRTPTSPWLTRPESPVLRAWRRTPRTPSCTRRTWLRTSCENMSGRNIGESLNTFLGVDVNKANANGETALRAAMAAEYDAVVELLVEQGATIN